MTGRSRNRKRMKAGASVAGDCPLKRKKTSASEGDEILERKKTSASEGGEILERKKTSASEGGEILERKKVFMKISPEDFLLGKKPKEVLPAGAPEKRKKVVMKRLPQLMVENIVASPYKLEVISADVLAKHTKLYRDWYAKKRDTADKIEAYQNGIIRQYNLFGYAEEETEVTDDEDD